MSVQNEVQKLIDEVKKSYIAKDFIQKTKNLLKKPNKYEVVSAALIQVMRQLQISGYPVYTKYLVNSGLNLNIAPDTNVVQVAYGTMSDLMQYLPRVGPEAFLDPLSSMIPENIQNKINYHRLRTVRVYAKLLFQLHQRWLKISSNNMKAQDGFIVLLPKELRPQGYKAAQCWCEKPKTFIQTWQTPGRSSNQNRIRFQGAEEIDEPEEKLLNYRSRVQHGSQKDLEWKQSLLDYQRSPKGKELVSLTQRAISQQNDRVASIRFSELDTYTQRRIKSQFRGEPERHKSHSRPTQPTKSQRHQHKRHYEKEETSSQYESEYSDEYSEYSYSDSERISSSRKSVQHMKSRRGSRTSRSKSSSGKGSPRSSGRRNRTLSPQRPKSPITTQQTNDYLRQQYANASTTHTVNNPQGLSEQELMQRYKTNLDNTPANYSTTADYSDTSMTQQQRKAAVMKDLGIDIPQNPHSTADELSSLKAVNKVEDFLPPEQKETILRDKRLNEYIMNVKPTAQSSQIPADDLINKYSDPERSSGSNVRSVEHQYTNSGQAASGSATKEVVNMAKYDNAVFVTEALNAGSQPLSSTQRAPGVEPSAGYQPNIQTLDSMSNMGQLYVRGGKNIADNSIVPQKGDSEASSKGQINDLLGKQGYTDAPTYPVYHHNDVYSDYQKQHQHNFFSHSTTSGSDQQQQYKVESEQSPKIPQQIITPVQEQVSPIKQRIVVDLNSDIKSNAEVSVPQMSQNVPGIAQNNILSKDQIKQELSSMNRRENQYGEVQQASVLSQQSAIKHLIEEQNDIPPEHTAMSVSVTPQTNTQDVLPIAPDTLNVIQHPRAVAHSVTPQDITNVIKSQSPIDYTTLVVKSQTPADVTTAQNYQTYEQNSIDVTSSEPNVDLSHARGRIYDSESEITQAGNLRMPGIPNPVLASTSVADPRNRQIGFMDPSNEAAVTYQEPMVTSGSHGHQVVPAHTSSSGGGSSGQAQQFQIQTSGIIQGAPISVPGGAVPTAVQISQPVQSESISSAFQGHLGPMQPPTTIPGTLSTAGQPGPFQNGVPGTSPAQPFAGAPPVASSSDYGTSNDLQRYTVGPPVLHQHSASHSTSGSGSVKDRPAQSSSGSNQSQKGTAIQNPSSSSGEALIPVQTAISQVNSQLTYSKLSFQPPQPQAKSSAVQSSGISAGVDEMRGGRNTENGNQVGTKNDVQVSSSEQGYTSQGEEKHGAFNPLLQTRDSISNIQQTEHLESKKEKDVQKSSQSSSQTSSKSLKQASFVESQKKISNIMSQVTETITSSADLLERINKANQNINSQLMEEDVSGTEITVKKQNSQDLSELEKLQQQGQTLLNKLAQEKLRDEIQSISTSIDIPRQGHSFLSTEEEELRKRAAAVEAKVGAQ